MAAIETVHGRGEYRGSRVEWGRGKGEGGRWREGGGRQEKEVKKGSYHVIRSHNFFQNIKLKCLQMCKASQPRGQAALYDSVCNKFSALFTSAPSHMKGSV